MTQVELDILNAMQELLTALYELDAGKNYSVRFEWRGMMLCLFGIYRGKYKVGLHSKRKLEFEALISYKENCSSQSQKTTDFLHFLWVRAMSDLVSLRFLKR